MEAVMADEKLSKMLEGKSIRKHHSRTGQDNQYNYLSVVRNSIFSTSRRRAKVALLCFPSIHLRFDVGFRETK